VPRPPCASAARCLRSDLALGHGIGKELRATVLSLAFDHLGAEYATSGSFVDSPASARVSLALGYEENGRDVLSPRRDPVPNEFLGNPGSASALVNNDTRTLALAAPADGRDHRAVRIARSLRPIND
jgi:hypothetical protein